MLQKIYDFANKGGFLRRLLATLAILAIVGVGGTVGFFLAIFLCMGVESLTGSDALTDLSIILFLPTGMLGLPWIMLKGLPHKRIKKTTGREYSRLLNWNQVVEYGETPYFGEMFGHDKTKKLLSDETFHLYTFENGKKAHYLRVSESGKWFSILGGHLPVDLICGYNKSKAELYTVDGVIIKLPTLAEF